MPQIDSGSQRQAETSGTFNVNLLRKSQELFQQRLHANYMQVDRLFVKLLICQWVAGIIVAIVVSPLTWSGTESSVHPHVWMAAALGGLFTFVPVICVTVSPGTAFTRHVVAIGQMLWSALLIHLTEGRIETHFHVFGSLAVLAFYRDWRVLLTATAIVAGDHAVRGYFYPISVYGVDTIQPWRWVEHAWWVIFEDFFLISSCIGQIKEMKSIAMKQVEVEEVREQVGELEGERNKYKHSYEKYMQEQVGKSHMDNVLSLSNQPTIGHTLDGTIFSWNRAAQEIYGYSKNDVVGKHIKMIVPGVKQFEIDELLRDAKAGKTITDLDTTRLTKDGRQLKVIINRVPITDGGGKFVGASEVATVTSQPAAAGVPVRQTANQGGLPG